MVGSNLLKNGGLYEFSVFRLDAVSADLTVDGTPVKIAPKVLGCLILLVDANGAVVPKEEFVEKVWPGEKPADSVLTYTISQLRKFLARYDADSKFIETFSKRGFRFCADVRNVSAEVPAITEVIERRVVEEIWIEDIDDEPVARPQLAAGLHNRSAFWYGASFAVVLIALAGGLFYYFFGKDSAPAKSNIRSVAVVPLRTFGSGQADESLRLRITDSIISRLGSLPNLSVRPLSATSGFLSGDEDTVAIGRQLEVDAIVEGRMQSENKRTRVTIQLIDVRTGRQLWADQFDGFEDRSLDLQDAIAAKLLREIDSGEVGRRGAPTTRNAVAYEEYLRGRFYWQKRTPDGLRSAISAFRRAIEADPDFSEAYVGLADAHFSFVDYGYDTSPENVEAAKRNLARALEIDPNNGAAYSVRSVIESVSDWNWQAAEVSARRGVELAPNSASAHHRLGSVLLLQRRFDEAETVFRRARDIDPTSGSINLNVGFALFYAKRYAEACRQFELTTELDQSFTAPKWFLARCVSELGDKRRSHQLIADALDIEGDKELAAQVRKVSAAADDAAVMRVLVGAWESQVSPTGITPQDMANIYARLGDAEATLKWLEKSIEIRHPWSVTINVSPEFDFVRDTPRFQALLRKMNFV